MFDIAIVCYLFLGGAGAGACLIAAALSLGIPREAFSEHALSAYRPLLVPSFCWATVSLALGIAFLLVDIGRIDRIDLLLLHPTMSHIAVGAFALVVALACAVAGAVCWGGLIAARHRVAMRILAILSMASSLVVMLYTGLLLGSLQSVPLWSGAWLPALFVLSSLSCGCAIVMASSLAAGAGLSFSVVLRRISACDAALMLLEAVCAVGLIVSILWSMPTEAVLAAIEDPSFTSAAMGDSLALAGGTAALPDELASLNATDRAALVSIVDLVAGSRSWMFWGGFAIVGLVVPFAIDVAVARGRFAVTRAVPVAGVVAAGCVLVGGFVLRYCLVEAGMQPIMGIV